MSSKLTRSEVDKNLKLIMSLGEADDVCFEIENREDQKIKSVGGCSFIIALDSMLPKDFPYLSSK